jgi:Mlc titration factor MtfA (ptsG expression regulator)
LLVIRIRLNMDWSLKNWRRRHVLRHATLPDEAWRAAISGLPVLLGLSENELERLRELVTLFLNEKQLVAAGGFALDNDMRIKIAAQACLPILNLGLDYYAGWVSVIVYPGEFVPEHEFMERPAWCMSSATRCWENPGSAGRWFCPAPTPCDAAGTTASTW